MEYLVLRWLPLEEKNKTILHICYAPAVAKSSLATHKLIDASAHGWKLRSGEDIKSAGSLKSGGKYIKYL